MLSRILAPVVFSARCQDAVRYAAALACRFGCELDLLHVFIQPWTAFASPEGYSSPPMLDISAELAEVQAELEKFLPEELARIPGRRVVREGDPARVIAEYACREDCGLIVMPTHGYGPFRRFLLGSVTAKVLNDVHCPIFTGPHLEHPPALESPKFRRVLCAIDLTPESRTVLSWATQFATEFASEISIVHAIPSSAVYLDVVYFDPAWREDLVAKTREKIQELQEEFHTSAPVLIETGEVAATVRAAAETWEADLVVAGRGQTHSLLGRLRTNTYGIVRESPCPVVAV